MLTPRFRLEQDDDFVIVHVHAPYIRSADVQWYVFENQFKFHVTPYFLRLSFSKPVCENGTERGTYDANTGDFTFHVPKTTRGEHFDDLAMLSKLLAPSQPKAPKTGPLIEVVGGQTEPGEVEFNWEAEQTVPAPDAGGADGIATAHYGFNSSYSGVLGTLQEELPEVVDLKDAERQTPAARRAMRTADEDAHFSEDHYLADFMEPEGARACLSYKPWWDHAWREACAKLQDRAGCPPATATAPQPGSAAEPRPALPCHSAVCRRHGPARCYVPRCPALLHARRPYLHSAVGASEQTPPAGWQDDLIVLTAEQEAQVLRLPRKEHLVDQPRTVMLGLVDILLAHAYDVRQTGGDNTTESAWTVCKLSSTLSWLEVFSSLEEVLVAFGRRCLSYPLHRHWDLLAAARRDVATILRLGRKAVLRCLLGIEHVMQRDEAFFILDKIYIQDYAVWVQTLSPSALLEVAHRLEGTVVEKDRLGLDIEISEMLALEQGEAAEPPPPPARSDETDSDDCTSGSGEDGTSSSDSDDSDDSDDNTD